MLGSLAKWLRILGVDTFYPIAEMTDGELLALSTNDNRMLLTRDKELAMRAKKLQIPVIELHTTNLDEQLHQVLNHIQLDSKEMLTRCTLCNTVLGSVQKNKVKTHVPPKVYESRTEFWFCPVCKKYYWMGTHTENMIQKITILTKKDSASS